MVPLSLARFAVNLQMGPSVNPRDDVALHLGFLLSPNSRLSVNTIQRNQWGTPMDYSSCPMNKMDAFQIFILVQRRAFMIALNNQHFCEFPHRMDPTQIRAIAMDGSVTVNVLRLEFPGGAQTAQNSSNSLPPQAPLYGNSQSGFPPMPASYSGFPSSSAPPNGAYQTTAPEYGRMPQNQRSTTPGSSMASLLTSGAALGALGGLAAKAAPLFYPGMKKKMKHKGRKQYGMFGPMGGSGSGIGTGSLLGTVGSLIGGGGHRYGPGYGHHAHGGGGGLLPGLGLGAAAGLGGAGLGYAMGHRHHHGGHGYGHRSSSSSSSSYSSDSD
ncbi:fibroin heavy chain-like isoform X2 [Paramacrobiotus metropolitanus]|uniref:fibroin heavy chain-like isoform X2 n=1 Tax=Paramacrobiotus metropolitanus TaxID=2943436 RepID=UPI0024465D2B|nr:fibroin heavy chain-like isoform X2 [Paramacrobiotus metropolitanus]